MAEPNSWEELLRKMLPEGAPLPDEDQLDYSISFDYKGPSPFLKTPTNPMVPKTRFTAFPKMPPSLTPKNPPWPKSRSSSDTTNSDNKRSSPSSIASDDATDDGVDTAGDNCRADGCERGSELKLGEACASSSGNKGRKCSRCGKGSIGILRGTEGCIVCGAEYCRKCVLKAMGSMPEGRKCVGCIGNPIDEGNRGKLGKASRFLERLCSRLEVKKIMEVERECKANQIRPQQITVNGRELQEDELDELLGCRLPPKGLKPGRYWYDKDSGLWGKVGEKPDRIVSSKLDVGGKLQTDASSGNTRVYMNGREITKVELRVLKLAKVQCPRDTHFWLYEDGSYEEEGQNNIKGNIWEKASIRFICSLLSLPIPPESANCTNKELASVSTGSFLECLEQQRVHKLLLLGLEGCGSSTIYKQAKLIYTNKFTAEELQEIKLTIQRNMYRYLSTLLDWREQFEEDALIEKESARLATDRSVTGEIEFDGNRRCIYSVNQKINNFSDWLLDLMATGDIDTFFPAAAREYAPLIDGILKDTAIQETYKRIQELQYLPDVARYFLDRVIEISSNEYEPSEKDILFAEDIVTPRNGLACTEFSFADHSVASQIFYEDSNSQLPLPKYQLIHLRSNWPHYGFKWLEMFEDTSAVVFCVSLTDYDQIGIHSGSPKNKMLESRNFFESVARSSCFDDTPFLLLLTKFDLFENKINRVPLTVCEWFGDFDRVKAHNKSVSMANQAFHYVAAKFKELYCSITGRRKLYVSQIRSRERKSVDEAFRYLREIIAWEEQKDGDIYATSDEDSVCDVETNPCPL